MTDNADPEPGAKPGTRPPRRITVGAVVRAAGSTAALVAIYYLLLLTRTAAWAAVTMLAAGLVAFIAMVAFRSAGSSGHGTRDCARSEPSPPAFPCSCWRSPAPTSSWQL